MMYGIGGTGFVQWAKGNGAALALDGIGMLVEQAAESFSIWRGKNPETGSVISLLSSERTVLKQSMATESPSTFLA